MLTLNGHINAVTSVAFSPDGQRLSSASHDKTVKIWDVVTGRELLTLSGHTNGINCVAFSPDGQRLASASNDRTVKLWDLSPFFKLPSPQTTKQTPAPPKTPQKTGDTITNSIGVKSDEWTWSEPVNLGRIVNTKSMEAEPTISADGLTLLFVSDRPGGLGKQDIWMSARAKANGPWSKPVNLGPTINSNGMDSASSLSSDGLTLFFSSDRPGGIGGYDLWKSRQSTRNGSWSKPVNLGATINSPQGDSVPVLSADSLTLLFSSTRPLGLGSSDIWMAKRPNVNSPWGKPVNLGPNVNSKTSDGMGDLSSDGLTLIFGSFLPEKQSRFVLWMSTRPSIDQPFGKRVTLGPIMDQWATASGASLSTDGRTLFFHSNHRGGQGSWDLWSVQRV